MDLSIAIVSYNVRDLLAECLSSVEESGRPLRQEVIVVDNASGDGSAEMIQDRFPHVQLIRNPQNLGFARACNQALRVSQGRYLLLLNPDTVVVGDCLPRMVEYMEDHPACGAATCRVWLDRNREWSLSNFEVPTLWREVLVYTHCLGRAVTPWRVLEREWRRRWEVWLAEAPSEIECIQGNFFLVRRRVFEQIGGLDERFFLYYEDVDWSRRIRHAGWKLFFYPGAGVIHHTSQSSKGVRDGLAGTLRDSQRHYLRKHFGWLRTRSVLYLLALDGYLSRLLRRVWGVRGDAPGTTYGPGAALDLTDGSPQLSWPRVPGATRYLCELSLNRVFLGTAARFVSTVDVELPRDELLKPGFPRVFWRAVPFRGDEPMPPWVRCARGARCVGRPPGVSA